MNVQATRDVLRADSKHEADSGAHNKRRYWDTVWDEVVLVKASTAFTGLATLRDILEFISLYLPPSRLGCGNQDCCTVF
jgi:hypothetical protein